MPARRHDDLPLTIPPPRDADAHEALADLASTLGHTYRELELTSSTGERCPVPAEIATLLRGILDELRFGAGVHVSPVDERLTTTRAAEILGVSRQTVARLVDSAVIPAERTRTRRTVLLRDVLTYQRARRRTLDPFGDDLSDLFPPVDLAAVLRGLSELSARSRERNTTDGTVSDDGSEAGRHPSGEAA